MKKKIWWTTRTLLGDVYWWALRRWYSVKQNEIEVMEIEGWWIPCVYRATCGGMIQVGPAVRGGLTWT